jgi:hypothetical protein
MTPSPDPIPVLAQVGPQVPPARCCVRLSRSLRSARVLPMDYLDEHNANQYREAPNRHPGTSTGGQSTYLTPIPVETNPASSEVLIPRDFAARVKFPAAAEASRYIRSRISISSRLCKVYSAPPASVSAPGLPSIGDRLERIIKSLALGGRPIREKSQLRDAPRNLISRHAPRRVREGGPARPQRLPL